MCVAKVMLQQILLDIYAHSEITRICRVLNIGRLDMLDCGRLIVNILSRDKKESFKNFKLL